MRPILVAGTGSWKDHDDKDWFCPGHYFGQFMTLQGLAPIYDGDRPFIWSTDLDGVPWAGKKDWAAGAAALSYFVQAQASVQGKDTALIAHSHALQVAAIAAAEHNLKINVLITMGSPIRKDMAKEYAALRANTKYWLHVHSDGSDRWQWLGEMFDGHFGIVRETPLADRNDFVPKVGHSELLRDPKQYHNWVEHKWLDLLKG